MKKEAASEEATSTGEADSSADRPTTPSSFAFSPLPSSQASAVDVDNISLQSDGSTAAQSIPWMDLLTGLLVDVRDTIANRLMENDEYVNDTDEYFLKLKNRLYHNDERRFESLHLHLHPWNPPTQSQSLDDIHTACQLDRAVRHLTFRVGMYDSTNPSSEDRWTSSQLQQLSQALLSLPKLEKLELCYYLQGIDNLIPAQDLIRGIHIKQHPELPPSRLKCLEIHHLHLLSPRDTQQLTGLAKSLQNNAMLQEFRLGTMSSCLQHRISLDLLFQSLATMVNLEQVEFTDQAVNSYCLGGVTLESETLAEFLRLAPSLKTLKINEESFDWDDNAILSIARVLKPNTRLQTLEIRREIGSYLRSLSSSTLQRMGLEQPGTVVTEQGYEALVEMLEHNYTLQAMDVYGNGKNSSPRSQRSRSESIQSENDGSSNGSTATAENRSSAVTTKKSNDLYDYTRRISFYLKLNRDGRKLLMQHEHNHEWVEAIIAHRDELDCLFHVLCSNPSIIQLLLLR